MESGGSVRFLSHIRAASVDDTFIIERIPFVWGGVKGVKGWGKNHGVG